MARDGQSNEVEAEEPVRTLVVRAKDGDWVMGEDLVLTVTGDETVVEIQEVISAYVCVLNIPTSYHTVLPYPGY